MLPLALIVHICAPGPESSSFNIKCHYPGHAHILDHLILKSHFLVKEVKRWKNTLLKLSIVSGAEAIAGVNRNQYLMRIAREHLSIQVCYSTIFSGHGLVCGLAQYHYQLRIAIFYLTLQPTEATAILLFRRSFITGGVTLHYIRY